MQDLALGFVEPEEVLLGSLLKPVYVSMDGIPSFECVNHTAWLGVIHKLAGVIFHFLFPTIIDYIYIYIINVNISIDCHIALSWATAQIKQTILSFPRDLPKYQSCSHRV